MTKLVVASDTALFLTHLWTIILFTNLLFLIFHNITYNYNILILLLPFNIFFIHTTHSLVVLQHYPILKTFPSIYTVLHYFDTCMSQWFTSYLATPHLPKKVLTRHETHKMWNIISTLISYNLQYLLARCNRKVLYPFHWYWHIIKFILVTFTFIIN